MNYTVIWEINAPIIRVLPILTRKCGFRGRKIRTNKCNCIIYDVEIVYPSFIFCRKYENIKSLKKSLKKLKYVQRQLSKKTKGSGQRNKQKIKLALIHEKVSNKRKDHLHKVSTEIIKNHDIICVEDLNVKGMIKNHKLAQALSDVGLGTFYNLLQYKASWNDKTIVKIDRFFPSSKMCSECNWINQELTLKDRKWTCLCCGVVHDRDVNASKNILLQGLNILSGLGTNSDIKQKQAESSSIEEAMKLEAQGSLAPG